MSSSSSIELQQVLTNKVQTVLEPGERETVRICYPEFEDYEAHELTLGATHTTFEGPAHELGERRKLFIGNGTYGKLASVQVNITSGTVEYTISKPYYLLEAIREGADLDSSIINPGWFLEPLMEDTELQLVSGGIPESLGRLSTTKVARGPFPLIYRGNLDATRAGAFLLDGAAELVTQELDETITTQKLFLDCLNYLVVAERRTTQADDCDVPHEDSVGFQYFAPDVNLIFESLSPNPHDPYSHLDIGVVTKSNNDVSGMHRVSMYYDRDSDPAVSVEASSVAYPLGGIQVENPLMFAATLLHNRLDQVIADIGSGSATKSLSFDSA